MTIDLPPQPPAIHAPAPLAVYTHEQIGAGRRVFSYRNTTVEDEARHQGLHLSDTKMLPAWMLQALAEVGPKGALVIVGTRPYWRPLTERCKPYGLHITGRDVFKGLGKTYERFPPAAEGCE